MLNITPAALHAALGELRKLGAERENDGEAAAFFIDGLNVLEALFDPAHTRRTKADERIDFLLDRDATHAPSNPPTLWPDDLGGTCHATPSETAGAAAAQEQGTSPTATAAAASRPDPANAGTPAPPTIEPPAGTGEAAPAASDTPAGTGAPERADGPSVDPTADGRHIVRAKPRAPSGGGAPVTKWTPERLDLLRREFPHALDRAELLKQVNALPGTPIRTVESMRQKAVVLKIKATPEVTRALQSEAGRVGGTASVALRPVMRPSEVRTPERLAALPALWNDQALTVGEIKAALNRLPGKPILAPQQLYGFARHLNLPTQRPMLDEAVRPAPADASRDANKPAAQEPAAPAPPPPPPPAPADTDEPTPEESAAIADQALLSKHDRCRQKLRALLKDKPKDTTMACAGIAAGMGLPLREVMRLLGEVRAEGAAHA